MKKPKPTITPIIISDDNLEFLKKKLDDKKESNSRIQWFVVNSIFDMELIFKKKFLD